ncbi:hypothetical protein ACHAXA_002738 [Cyclostephanos tholiformis]|uniref:VOC domain-containing protein n=1 Tax=Cyclostephanos tholiformis TaxID=382380 RepID=A0ABD3RDZ2_9STRA
MASPAISTRATRQAFLVLRSSSFLGTRSQESPPSTSSSRLPSSTPSYASSSHSWSSSERRSLSSSYSSKTTDAIEALPLPPPPTSIGGSTRPFRVLGLQQIALGSLEKSDMTNIWTNVFGLSKFGTYRSEKENVDEDLLILGKHGSPYAVELDLMIPIDPNKSPKVHVPPLNHIGLWIDDLRAAVAWMEGRGVRFTPGGIRKGASGHDVTFIHPKGNEESPIGGAGVLIELVQAPEEVIKALT